MYLGPMFKFVGSIYIYKKKKRLKFGMYIPYIQLSRDIQITSYGYPRQYSEQGNLPVTYVLLYVLESPKKLQQLICIIPFIKNQTVENLLPYKDKYHKYVLCTFVLYVLHNSPTSSPSRNPDTTGRVGRHSEATRPPTKNVDAYNPCRCSRTLVKSTVVEMSTSFNLYLVSRQSRCLGLIYRMVHD